jgi:hypothetical protein
MRTILIIRIPILIISVVVQSTEVVESGECRDKLCLSCLGELWRDTQQNTVALFQYPKYTLDDVAKLCMSKIEQFLWSIGPARGR